MDKSQQVNIGLYLQRFPILVGDIRIGTTDDVFQLMGDFLEVMERSKSFVTSGETEQDAPLALQQSNLNLMFY